MKSNSQNEGIHVLADFVCEAVHAPEIPRADERRQGRNEGMLVMEELAFDASSQGPAAEKSEDQNPGQPAPGSAIEDAIKSEVSRLGKDLTVIISASDDRLGALALFQKLLLAELDGIQKSAVAGETGNRGEPGTF